MGKIDSYSNATTYSDSDQLLGTDSDDSSATKNFTLTGIHDYMLNKKTSVPATAGDTGTAGDYAVASGFLYVCVATNTWERVAIATW
jgi:hypothetical protein